MDDKKYVTKEFFVITLIAALAVNIAITACLLSIFTRPHVEIAPDQIEAYEEPGEEAEESHANIGVVIRADENGVYVVQVKSDNAKAAGFKDGDKIIAVNGEEVHDADSLISEVQSYDSGDKIKVTVERNGKKIELETILE